MDECDTIIETIGGVDIAREIVFYALEQGEKVVTANKHLLATFGQDLLPKYRNQLKFEATVCAAIPIIKLMKHYYKHDEIIGISAILNGTTNYILTQVANGKMFNDALKMAQEFGFVEMDPAFDIDGIDAGHKAIIFALFGVWIMD